MPKKSGTDKIAWGKLATIVGIVGSLLGMTVTMFTLYNGLLGMRDDIVGEVNLNRTILVDDLEIRRDQKARHLELSEAKLKLLTPTDTRYIDVRDNIFSLRDTIDDLNRLIRKAKDIPNE